MKRCKVTKRQRDHIEMALDAGTPIGMSEEERDRQVAADCGVSAADVRRERERRDKAAAEGLDVLRRHGLA